MSSYVFGPRNMHMNTADLQNKCYRQGQINRQTTIFVIQSRGMNVISVANGYAKTTNRNHRQIYNATYLQYIPPSNNAHLEKMTKHCFTIMKSESLDT